MNIFYVFVLFLSVTVITITKSIPKTRICQGWETFWIYQVGDHFGCIKLGNVLDVSSWETFWMYQVGERLRKNCDDDVCVYESYQ